MLNNFKTLYKRTITKLFIKNIYNTTDFIAFNDSGIDCLIDIASNRINTAEERVIRSLLKVMTFTFSNDKDRYMKELDIYKTLFNNFKDELNACYGVKCYDE